jgi:hypothetical protein
MKKLILSLTILLALFSHQLLAQNKVTKTIGCGVAVAQLLRYANQVNNFYKAEYFTGIPNYRCPAFDQWGRPFPPLLVQNCRNQYVIMLNNWYVQQANYVNAWQGQIVNTCLAKPPKKDKETTSNDDTAKIDTEEIKDLQVGVDEDKAIKITIPKTAEGYKPR